MKVEELDGAQLDYWVARAEGIPAEALVIAMAPARDKQTCSQRSMIGGQEFVSRLDYTTNWGSSGPIVERERIGVAPSGGGTWASFKLIEPDSSVHARAHAPLVAAMRAYVASKFGDVVEDS